MPTSALETGLTVHTPHARLSYLPTPGPKQKRPLARPGKKPEALIIGLPFSALKKRQLRAPTWLTTSFDLRNSVGVKRTKIQLLGFAILKFFRSSQLGFALVLEIRPQIVLPSLLPAFKHHNPSLPAAFVVR